MRAMDCVYPPVGQVHDLPYSKAISLLTDEVAYWIFASFGWYSRASSLPELLSA